MTVVTLSLSKNERVLMGLLTDAGLTQKQVTAGMKYYRNLLSKFDKYDKYPERAVGPIVKNIENMKEAYR